MKPKQITSCALSATLLGLSINSAFAGDTDESKQVISEPEDSWEYSLSPYFMMAGLSGDVGLGGMQEAVDASFGDLADHLDAGLAGYFEARKGKWGFGVDAFWMKLSGGSSVGGIQADMGIEEVRAKALTFYRLCEKPSTTFDVYAGVSYNYVDIDLTLSGPGAGKDLRSTEGWFDPVIGFRVSHDWNDKWFSRVLGELGGFGVSSDLNWEAMASLGYHINHRWDAVLAYRGIGIDYEDDGFLYDVTMSGPMLGVTFNW